MPAYGFMPMFVEDLLAGRKPHTVRAVRKDLIPPRVGQAFHAYCGMRTLACTWLFSSKITKTESIAIGPEIEGGVPWIRLKTREHFRSGHVPVMALDATLKFIITDGFRLPHGNADIDAFCNHFLPKKGDAFIGHLTHWDPEDARAAVHSCQSCGERLRWSASCRGFVCVCTDVEVVHRFKRPQPHA